MDPGVDEADEIGIPARCKLDRSPPAQHCSGVVIDMQERDLVHILLRYHDEGVHKLVHLHTIKFMAILMKVSDYTWRSQHPMMKPWSCLVASQSL